MSTFAIISFLDCKYYANICLYRRSLFPFVLITIFDCCDDQ